MFLQPITDATGWSRTSVSAAMTLAFLAMGMAGFGWGALSDRFGARPVVLAGSVLLGLGLVAASRASSPLEFMLAYGLLVGVASGSFFVPMISPTGREARGARTRCRSSCAASFPRSRGWRGETAFCLAADPWAAGQPEKLRDAHLAKIPAPVLCFNGTRDALCNRPLMEKTISGLRGWTMHWIEGADHSFHVLKSSGRTDGAVLQEVGDRAGSWLHTCMNVQYHPSSGGPHGA